MLISRLRTEPITLDCPINDLPDELLAYIFEIGLRDDHEEDDTSEDEWETDDEAEGEDGVAMIKREKAADVDTEMVDANKTIPKPTLVLPFEVKVSHVCVKWRGVALATPTLWTSISLRPPFTRSEAYLLRSVGAPLDVKVDSQETGVLYDWLAMDNDDEAEYMSLEDFNKALDIVIPHVHRWKSFEISVHDYHYMHPTLSRLSELPGAPMLEQLRLYHHDVESETDETFSPAELREPRVVLFSGNTPKLAELALWGVHVDWTRTITHVRNLVDLELAYHTQDVRPSFKDFSRILKRSTGSLRTMSLCGSGPAGESHDAWLESFDEEEIRTAAMDGDGSTSVMSIHLPALRHLNVAYHTPEYAAALVNTLSMPGLTDLSLDYELEDFSPYANALARSSFLPNITSLKLQSLPCDVECIVSLLRRMKTNLRMLNISFNFCDSTWFKLLTNLPSAEGRVVLCEDDVFPIPSPPVHVWSTAASRPPENQDSTSSVVDTVPLLPKLESISVSGLTAPQVRFFVERRKAMGVPLREMWVDEDTMLEPDDEEWLRANLEKFERFELSDVDTDDDFYSDDDEDFWMGSGDEEEDDFSDDDDDD